MHNFVEVLDKYFSRVVSTDILIKDYYNFLRKYINEMFYVQLWLYDVFFSWQSELDVSFISVITQSIIDQTWLWLSSVMHVYLWGFHSLMHNQIMFNLDKVHIILDEMILNGHIVETNKNQILAPLLALDKMAESWSNANEISLIFGYKW